jgi:mevalonate kinase
MKLVLSAPSKTFLVGEYAVLTNGSALVLNTSPRFELHVQRGDFECSGIPEGSPAWRWLQARRPLLDGFQLEFKDPHTGLGGLGASGAQFLLVHTLTTCLQSDFAAVMEGSDLMDVWNDHQVLTNSQGSGADIWAQCTGGVTRVEMSVPTAQTMTWPYPDLAWSIVRTHQKVATHEHLTALDRSQLSLLVRPAHDCVEAFDRAPEEVFLSKLKDFSNALRELNLQAPTTMSLSQVLESENWCLLAKGCGALGADTVLMFYHLTEKERVATFLKKQRLTTIATSQDLSHGLEMKWL